MMIHIRNLGSQPYLDIWEQMKNFTSKRDANTVDELWLLEHPPVYTQGQAGKPEHVFNPNSIPVIQSDRGGQVTYHGPGQLVAYVLMDIRRRHLGIRTLVGYLEQILIAVLENYQIKASTRCGAPGVYVDDKKIASIGLRVKNGCTYHGIALNVAMDLGPFSGINPCGFARLEMTQISDYVASVDIIDVAALFTDAFLSCFDR
ncbi:lipoyl(octanoyl) transferase LipB [Legionella micdadei]|uniref:Octanoyltransferase n=1 Tax=Legionella micdadei TaxID=451 RepID=A0A098GEC8_LEGMI|nr:lipoyl(octanoyl) transferase LipB [Legionella micdadei]KTD27681.1 lipoyltransferase [Legionella micdadei]NSL17665.1 lipoyl(octanoyl) transferase LipB [Legionella micdadei]CEG60833.1 Octanoyltransferase [Legionella micdadei]SCY14606.1 lipoyl(octanoyl) transferase [Legionella micdadei]